MARWAESVGVLLHPFGSESERNSESNPVIEAWLRWGEIDQAMMGRRFPSLS